MGTRGPAGPRGDTGATGPRGPKGDKGEPGLPAAAIVLASEGPGGNCTEGGVSVSVGTTTEYVCNGAQGVKGDTGDTGQAGDDGIDCWDLNEDRDCDDLAGADGDEDANSDDVCNALDCRGAKGDAGDQGAKGDPGAYTVADANDTVLGQLVFTYGPDRLFVRTAAGVLVSYVTATGEVQGYDASVSVELKYESNDCTGAPLYQSSGGNPSIIDGAVFNNGQMYKLAFPKVSTFVNSARANNGSCGPVAQNSVFLQLELVGAKPPDAMVPLQIW